MYEQQKLFSYPKFALITPPFSKPVESTNTFMDIYYLCQLDPNWTGEDAFRDGCLAQLANAKLP